MTEIGELEATASIEDFGGPSGADLGNWAEVEVRLLSADPESRLSPNATVLESYRRRIWVTKGPSRVVSLLPDDLRGGDPSLASRFEEVSHVEVNLRSIDVR